MAQVTTGSFDVAVPLLTTQLQPINDVGTQQPPYPAQVYGATTLTTGTQSPTIEIYGWFNVSFFGSFTTVTAFVEKSFDGGTTFVPAAPAYGTVNLSATSAATAAIFFEPEHAMLYRVNATTVTTGALGFRIAGACDQ